MRGVFISLLDLIYIYALMHETLLHGKNKLFIGFWYNVKAFFRQKKKPISSFKQ